MLEWFNSGAQTTRKSQCYAHLVTEKNQGSEN